MEFRVAKWMLPAKTEQKKMIILKLAGLEQCFLKSDLFGDGKIIPLHEETISFCVLCQCKSCFQREVVQPSTCF